MACWLRHSSMCLLSSALAPGTARPHTGHDGDSSTAANGTACSAWRGSGAGAGACAGVCAGACVGVAVCARGARNLSMAPDAFLLVATSRRLVRRTASARSRNRPRCCACHRLNTSTHCCEPPPSRARAPRVHPCGRQWTLDAVNAGPGYVGEGRDVAGQRHHPRVAREVRELDGQPNRSPLLHTHARTHHASHGKQCRAAP